MVIWKYIKSHLSYFIVGQGKECTYVYFHILYWFQLCFKTLCKRFKHNIKILLGANFVWINKSSLNNYQNKIIFQMVRVLVSESESLQCMIIKTQIHQCSPVCILRKYKNSSSKIRLLAPKGSISRVVTLDLVYSYKKLTIVPKECS